MLYQLNSSRAAPVSSRKAASLATIRDKIVSPLTKLRDTGPAKRCHRISAHEGFSMIKLTILSGAALLTVASVAAAQPGDRPGPDADITRQQVIDRADQAFARMDANHDGRFTPEEARATGEQRRTEMRGRMFDRLDANHDGNISRDEFAQAHAMHGPGGHRGRRMGPPPGGPGGDDMGPPPPGGPDGPDGRAGPGGPGMRGQRMFGAAGFVTAEQFRARALERFDRADADHNGTVTVAERQAMRGQMRGRMRGPRSAPEAPPAN
jgi:EF-hand domain pair